MREDDETTQPIARPVIHSPLEGAPALRPSEDIGARRRALGIQLGLVASTMAFLGLFLSWILLAAEAGVAGQPHSFRPGWTEQPSASAVLVLAAALLAIPAALFAATRIAKGQRIALGCALLGTLSALAVLQAEAQRLHQNGTRIDGYALPELDVAEARLRAHGDPRPRKEIAAELFGARDLAAEPLDDAFSEADYLARALLVRNAEAEDHRPKIPGLMHLPTYGIRASLEAPAQSLRELEALRAEAGPAGQALQVADERRQGARISAAFPGIAAATFGFLGLHLAALAMVFCIALVRGLLRPQDAAARSLAAGSLPLSVCILAQGLIAIALLVSR